MMREARFEEFIGQEPSRSALNPVQVHGFGRVTRSSRHLECQMLRSVQDVPISTISTLASCSKENPLSANHEENRQENEITPKACRQWIWLTNGV
jgi:hypothetical protein